MRNCRLIKQFLRVYFGFSVGLSKAQKLGRVVRTNAFEIIFSSEILSSSCERGTDAAPLLWDGSKHGLCSNWHDVVRPNADVNVLKHVIDEAAAHFGRIQISYTTRRTPRNVKP